jgi:UDP-N-acetyl-D-glucosamine dehydrogenase
VSDSRESPSIKIIELLEKRGADVYYNDHLIPELHFGEGHRRVLHSTPLDDLASFDCVVLATDHSAYDFARLVRESKLLVDTRNATRARGKSHVFVL